jgi:hypothetical protein
MSEPSMQHNIGPDGIRIRAFLGVLFFVFAFGMMALLTVVGAPLPFLMGTFLPIWIGTLSLLQAMTGTCVFLAARGACTTEMGSRRIDDEDLRKYFVRRSSRIHLQALASALVLTLLLVLLSVLIPWRVPV